MEHYTEKDIKLYEQLEHMEVSKVDIANLCKSDSIAEYEVYYPKEGSKFLHEAAIIEFKGTLFASWYSCPEKELEGTSSIIERRSNDNGKSWTEPKEICRDETGKILYCPPIYHIEDGKLYMLINEMVSADHMHSLDLFVLNEETNQFEMLWSKPVPFKLNTNVIKMDNGKLLMPGRIAELDKFPKTPAVLIADNGNIDSDYRLVKIQKDGWVSDETELLHPEISPIIEDGVMYMYCRNDNSNVPLLYISGDYGETWSKAVAHNIPFSNSKMYAGTLSNNRKYIIGNIYPGRSKLVILLTEPDKSVFTEGYILQDGYSDKLGYGDKQWSYPCAYEYDGKLYVIYSVDNEAGRGAVMSVIPIDL